MLYQVLYLHYPKSPSGPLRQEFLSSFEDEETDNIKQLLQSQIIITNWED